MPKKTNPVMPVTLQIAATIPQPVWSKFNNLCRKHELNPYRVAGLAMFAMIIDIAENNHFQHLDFQQCVRELSAEMGRLEVKKQRMQFHDA